MLLAGFEMVQTYWLYTYIPWFFPFAAIALLVPARDCASSRARPVQFAEERLAPEFDAAD